VEAAVTGKRPRRPRRDPWADYQGTYAAGPKPSADAKPARAADAKPARAADAKPKPGPADAKGMYDDGETRPDEEAAPTPRKATAKKRGGKAGAKKPRAKS
jgi:hypothetical protein